MKKCPNCGKVFWDDAENCPDCHRSLIFYDFNDELNYSSSSNVFKKVAIAVGILFFVVGIIAGFLFKTVDESSIFAEEKFNYVLMFSMWFSGVLPVLASYAVYAHLKNQEAQIRVQTQIKNELSVLNNRQ